MKDLDKTALGERIRRIRGQAGLRQWELARLLGTTQSAVHKYEHGVVPEPRRLVELARIGGTSIEWILTGRHWENGSEDQKRVSAELLQTACALRELEDSERGSLEDALRILREAARAVAPPSAQPPGGAARAHATTLGEHSRETLALLECAWRIQAAVLKRLAAHAAERLETSPLLRDGSRSSAGESGGTAGS